MYQEILGNIFENSNFRAYARSPPYLPQNFRSFELSNEKNGSFKDLLSRMSTFPQPVGTTVESTETYRFFRTSKTTGIGDNILLKILTAACMNNR